MDPLLNILIQWFFAVRDKLYAWGSSAFGNTPFDDGGK